MLFDFYYRNWNGAKIGRKLGKFFESLNIEIQNVCARARHVLLI